MPTASAEIDPFIDAAWLHDGLSPNTLTAYRQDLSAFSRWLNSPRNKTLHEAEPPDIQAWSAADHTRTRASTANRRLATLRRFYRWAIRNGRLSTDPCLNLKTARQPERFPNTLSEQQVVDLLLAPDTDTALGLRDRTMLETLYATGLRVSELINLDVLNVNTQEGVVRVTMGKGGKDRLVPMGAEALHWLDKYMAHARTALLGARTSDALFVTSRGKAM